MASNAVVTSVSDEFIMKFLSSPIGKRNYMSFDDVIVVYRGLGCRTYRGLLTTQQMILDLHSVRLTVLGPSR